MENSKTNSNQIDRLSNLPYELLVTILSFLPTHIAARTSVLCRSFRHLWEASPSLALISEDLPYPQPEKDNFIAMAERALLCRNPNHPLHSLRLEISRCDPRNESFLCSLLTKARCLDLRHLTIEGCNYADFSTILPIILTMTTLRCLSLDSVPPLRYGIFCQDYPKFKFPSRITLTCLRSLFLELSCTNLEHFNPLFSQLCCLEDLHLDIRDSHGLSLYSQTLKKLKLVISLSHEHHCVVLSLPSLESLYLETHHKVKFLSRIRGDVPLLRKAVINLYDLVWGDVSVVDGLLNWISHVEELRLHAKQRRDVDYPIPILMEPDKDVPKFSNLKHLDVTLCFHNLNFEAIIRMLHNCPVLESLKLFHEKRRMRDAGSKLPRNADGNYRYAIFKNLHLDVDNKAFMKLMGYKDKYPFRYWRVGRTLRSRLKLIFLCLVPGRIQIRIIKHSGSKLVTTTCIVLLNEVIFICLLVLIIYVGTKYPSCVVGTWF